MDYLLKSSAIIFIFYACYKLFLQRDTFFESNRWFLLIGLIIASCIPLVIIPIYIEYTPVSFSEFTISNSSGTTTQILEEQFNYLQLVLWIYLFGLLFFTGKLIIELFSLKRILKTGRLLSFENFKLIETDEQITPFSFFNYIVYNPTQFNELELQHVINHEQAHSQQLHSVDTIIAQIACVLLWFNPFIWLYKRALQQNLEFIADQKAQYVSPCEKSYQTVLLKASVKNHQLVFTNNFYTSLIKKRIIMLHKSKSKKLNQLKLILILPLLAVFIMSFNTETIYVESNSIESDNVDEDVDSEKIIEIIITKNTSNEDLTAIKSELKSNGIDFNYSNVKRNSDGEITSINTEFESDENSSNYNISGKDGIKSFRFKSGDDIFSVGTLGSNSFVYKTDDDNNAKIQSTGSSSNIVVIHKDDVKSSSSFDKKSIENKNTINSVKKTSKFILLTDDEDSAIFIDESEEPIFIINGKKVNKSLFEDVDSDDVESIFVIKGDNALEKYGNEGENGVIIMTKKGSNNLFSKSVDNVIIKSNEFTFETDGDEPLFILDGQVINKKEMNDINVNIIENVEVLKDKSAVTRYGKKGENGVVVINTKKNAGNSKTVTTVYSNDYKNVISLTKDASKADLEQLKNKLKSDGIDAKFSKVRRNKAGEITSIKITLDDNNGRKSSASFKEKSQAIPKIVMGKKGDKLFINSIEN